MTFESAQHNYKGQKGWNDLEPDALNLSNLANKNVRGKVRPRRVATPIFGAEPNSLPTSNSPIPPMPPMSAAPPLTLTMSTTDITSSTKASTNSETNSSTSTNADETPVCIEELKSEIEVMGKRFADQGAAEARVSQSRICSLLEALSPQQLSFIREVLNVSKQSDGKAKARKMLVDYSLLHSNVSCWTVPLRRLVEQQL